MMTISRKTWIVVGAVFFIFAMLWLSQILYFDTLTKKLTGQDTGPVFRGQLSENLNAAVSRPFTISTGEKTITIEPEQVQQWIEPYHRVFTRQNEYRINKPAIENTLDDFVAGLAIKPINGKFGFVDNQIVETTPSVMGRSLDLEASRELITQALVSNQSSASLAFADVEPELSVEGLAKMGITTMIGSGTSNFKGSIASRVHNIKIGASKINGSIIAPGASFSFVNTAGDIDAAAGYVPGLVIKNGVLIPEYGGGICQVSTTLFRTAIYSGLPIDERRPHSIPVRFYNPQGFDSTIYPGVVDLRFTNNTPGPILIQSRIEGTTLTFDMFGASDGRVTKMDGPYQYDFQPNGALKAVFTRIITLADGTEKKESFYSSYKSPNLEVIKNPLE